MSERIAIIGCGRMGREHAANLQMLDATIAYLIDNNPLKLKELQEHYPSAKTSDRLNEEDIPKIDAIFVCTPPGNRKSWIDLAIKYKTPFFSEKPIGVSSRQCEPSDLALKQVPLINAVGYMNRYRESVRHAKSIITEAPDAPLGFVAHWVGRAYNVDWWKNPINSGGPFNEQATHIVDLARFLMGEINDVSRLFTRPAKERNGLHSSNAFAFALQFETGAVGTVFYSFGAMEKDIAVKVFLPNRTLHLSGWSFDLIENAGSISHTPNITENPFLAEVAAFLEAIREKNQGKILSSYSDAILTQRVVDKIVDQSTELAKSI